jgi:hypothetical protein
VAKQTEGNVLTHLQGGGALTNEQRAALVAKMAKGQSKSRARNITGVVETQFATQLAQMTAGEQAIVKRGVSDYTQDSESINNSCRAGAPNAAALNLDAMFGIYVHHGFSNQQRVVYRLMTYKPPAVPPYGRPAAPQIIAGDFIKDDGFFSSSEHRQFLINGIKNPPPGSRYVTFCIIGQGGANISGGAYTNANEQRFLEMENPKTHYFKTAHAGQAEILFPRGTILHVESVSATATDIFVMATIPNPQPVGGAVKNGFTGT